MFNFKPMYLYFSSKKDSVPPSRLGFDGAFLSQSRGMDGIISASILIIQALWCFSINTGLGGQVGAQGTCNAEGSTQAAAVQIAVVHSAAISAVAIFVPVHKCEACSS